MPPRTKLTARKTKKKADCGLLCACHDIETQACYKLTLFDELVDSNTLIMYGTRNYPCVDFEMVETWFNNFRAHREVTAVLQTALQQLKHDMQVTTPAADENSSETISCIQVVSASKLYRLCNWLAYQVALIPAGCSDEVPCNIMKSLKDLMEKHGAAKNPRLLLRLDRLRCALRDNLGQVHKTGVVVPSCIRQYARHMVMMPNLKQFKSI